MSTYTHTSYLQFRNLILARLGDSVFYTDDEVKRYALETLRCWNALAQFNRDRGLLSTSNGVAFYDLPSLLDKSGVKILGYNLKDQDLFLDIKYALMEDAATVNTWTGTSQFTLQDCQDAIEKARNEFLLRSNTIQTHSTVALPAPPASRISLSDSIIDVQRAAFKSNVSGSAYRPLNRSEEFSASAFRNNWNTDPSSPIAYSVILTPKVSLQLIPVSNLGGTLSVVSLNAGASCDLSSGVLLSIPDDWAWAIKWKALFYLLSKDGEASDKFRADYCNQRFEESLIAAQVSSPSGSCFINDRSLIPDSLNSFDKFNPSWQSISGTPSKIAWAGRNLIALSKVPNGVYSVMLDVVRNHPVPVNDGDFIQVGREHLNALVDYAVHIAMFKQGGGEFAATMPLRDNLYQLAMENNLRLKAQAKELERIRDAGRKQSQEVPMYAQAMQ